MNDRPPARRIAVPRVQARISAVVRPRFLSAGRLAIERRCACPLHQHLNYEMVYVERGTYRTRVNHMPLTIAPGHLLAVTPGDWHEDEFHPQLVIHCLHFSLEVPALAAQASLFRPGVAASHQVVDCRGTVLREIMLGLRQQPAVGDAIDAGLQDARAAVFFWQLLRRLRPESLAPGLIEGDPHAGFLLGLRRIIERHLDRALPVQAMAEGLGMSVSALTVHCRRCCRRSPAQVFAAAKVERAEALLSRTAMSVLEVSRYLGYADQFHFSKVFKRYAGIPPSRVRRRRR